MAHEILIGSSLHIAAFVIQKVVQEASRVIHFGKHVEWLKAELNTLNEAICTLNNPSISSDVKEWVKKVREVVYDAQDVVELVICAGENNPQWCSVFPYRMVRRIDSLKERVKSIHQDGKKLKLYHQIAGSENSTCQAQSRLQLRRSSVQFNEHQVGMESNIRRMVEHLEDSKLQILSVEGMGGIGKTLLLQHVFKKTKDKFDMRIWLAFSQESSIKQLQRDIAAQIGLASKYNNDFLNRIEKESEDLAAREIHDCLVKRKRCLIVLDDVWSSQQPLLQRIGLPLGKETCKILISTRNRQVSVSTRATSFIMEPLSEEDSYRLFCLHAFPSNSRTKLHVEVPQHLRKVVQDIVKECKILPLALKTIGASLAGEVRLPEWTRKLEQLRQVGPVRVHGDEDVKPILKLSYDWMSAPLKQCFLYCSFFPAHENIDCEYLISLWNSEGFLNSTEGAEAGGGAARADDPSIVGLDYLNQLSNLCLIQVWEDFDEDLKMYCRMHDLLWNICISMCKEDSWLFDLNLESGDSTGNLLNVKCGPRCRRVSVPQMGIHCDSNTSIPACPFPFPCSGSCFTLEPLPLRTLSLSSNPSITNIPTNFFSNFQYVRVLDVSRTSISSLPKSVRKLKLLRVLNMSYTQIKELPRCVKRLKSLQFLDVSGCEHLKNKTLPDWISEVKSLRHLVIDDDMGYSYSHLPEGLRKLRGRNTRPLQIAGAEHLSKLKNLQEIQLLIDERDNTTLVGEGNLFEQILNMRDLSLSLAPPSTSCEANVNCLPIPSEKMLKMEHLQKLHMEGYGVPTSITGFNNLEVLSLCRCAEADYPALQTMPILRKLELADNNICSQLPQEFGCTSGFPRLEWLKLSCFPRLEKFPKLDKGAMTRLKYFKVEDCTQVSRIPKGLHKLSSLEVLSVERCHTLSQSLYEGKPCREKLLRCKPHLKIYIDPCDTRDTCFTWHDYPAFFRSRTLHYLRKLRNPAFIAQSN